MLDESNVEFENLNGILLVDKEPGITSYQVIRRLKPFFPRKYKIGHGGTLDPFASGLLIILIGKGTKLSSQFIGIDKEYEFEIEFGYETDTQDVTGELIKNAEIPAFDISGLQNYCAKMVGTYSQMPPQYSAKKVNGKPAYKSAREGIHVELTPKDVTIHSFEVTDVVWPMARIRALVSSGTYIRTLTLDLAKSMGSLATTEVLRRTKVGKYDVTHSVKSANLTKETILDNIINLNDVR